MAATAISKFYRSLRVVLGDLDASVRKYPDSVLADGVKAAVELGKVEHNPAYVLNVDESGIEPEVGDANQFALFVYHTAKLFIAPSPDRYSFRTRAFSESFGSLRHFLESLELELHRLENGEMFSGWQDYYAWLSGMAGLPLAAVLTDFEIEAPLYHATLNREGVSTVPNDE